MFKGRKSSYQTDHIRQNICAGDTIYGPFFVMMLVANVLAFLVIMQRVSYGLKVSVIIPTRNAGTDLELLLGSLSAQTITPDEIIVIDSNSTDGTPNKAEEHGAHVLHVNPEDFDHGGTRNYAASHASGDILVFMTQDAIPADNRFLETLLESFEDQQVAAAYGRQVARPLADPLEKMTREFNYSNVPLCKSMADVEKLGIKTFFFTNVCSAVRRGVFISVGRFPEPIILNEDMILAAKCVLAGYSVRYAADARVLHSHQYTLAQQFRRHFDIGVSLRMNDWLLEYTTPAAEGRRLAKFQFRKLIKPGMRRWIPRWLAETAAKYSGYRLGLGYRRIPARWREKFTMHSAFWRKRPFVLQNALKKKGTSFLS